MPNMTLFFRAFFPIRITAAATTAMTAGLRPLKMDATQETSPVGRIDVAQREEKEHGRDDEQGPGRDSAGMAVEQLADVGGQLLGLGPRQEHAVVQGVEEALVC